MTLTPQPSRPRTLSIGGATYDLFVRTGSSLVNGGSIQLKLGEKIPVSDVIETCGGGASNTAVGFKRLGCDSGFCGIIGSDQWGQRLLKNFNDEGVDTSALTIVEDEMTSFSLILSASSGERTILYNSGANAHLHDATFDKASAFTCDWIFLNHIHDRSCIIEDDLIEILSKQAPSPLPSPSSPDARERGQKKHADLSFEGPGLSWNPGGCHIEKGMHEEHTQALLKQTDLLFLNKEEAMAFTGTASIEDAFQALIKAGVKLVFITDGQAGAQAADGTHLYHCPVIADATIVDTTGAGDAFATGVTWAKLQGLSLPQMLQTGTINATSVLGSFGAEQGLLTHTDMHTRLEHTPLAVHVTDFPLLP